MRVLQVVPGMSPQFGGPSVHLVDLARALTSRGVDVTIFTTNADPIGRLDVPLAVPVDERGARLIYFNVWPRGRYAFSIGLADRLRRAVVTYDVVHAHWLYSFPPLAAAFFARQEGVPFVLQPNGSLHPHLMRKNLLVKRVYLATLGKFVMRNASALVFTSEEERREAVRFAAGADAFVVPVGLDWHEYGELPALGQFKASMPELADKQLILFLGRLSRQKGLDLLLPAFRSVAAAHPAAHLVIAGPDGEGYGARLRDWVRTNSLSERVTFVGPLYGKRKLAAYVDCDVFVLPSYGENFGGVVTEALACRRPVVISDRVNIHPDIARADAGIVVQCAPESVADGIDTLLRDHGLARRLGENGRRLVRERFTWDAAVDSLLEVYEDVTSAGRTPEEGS